MNAEQLRNKRLEDKITKLAYDYRTLYGVFPDKVGIHASQYPSFLGRHMQLPELPSPSLEIVKYDQPMEACPTFTTLGIHTVTIESVEGIGLVPDEVYVQMPGRSNHTVSGTFIAKMAKEFEE